MRERWLTLSPPNFYVQRDHGMSINFPAFNSKCTEMYWPTPTVLSSLPWPLRVLIGNKIYNAHTTTLQGQGVGRFSESEAKLLREEIWSDLNSLLLDSLNQTQPRNTQSDPQRKEGWPFWVLGGENPTECDTTVFGFISSALIAESGPETREFVKGLEGCMEYARRIHFQWFGEYEIWETWSLGFWVHARIRQAYISMQH